MKNKDLAYFEKLPYTTLIRRDDDCGFVARIQELPGCLAHGDTEAEAIELLRSVQQLWLEDAIEAGDPIPEPESEALPSGKWVQRVPRTLHRDLARLALKEEVSLNQLVTSLLSEAVMSRSLNQLLETRYQEVGASHRAFQPLCWPVDDHNDDWSRSAPATTHAFGYVSALGRMKLFRPMSHKYLEFLKPEEAHAGHE